jgi:hypothetical protein
MARSKIVAPGADKTVAVSEKSLWIVPELWKNAKGAFSHKLVGRAKNARPHAPRGAIIRTKDRDDGVFVTRHYAWQNGMKIHQRLCVTPAMAIGVTERLWRIEDLVALLG